MATDTDEFTDDLEEHSRWSLWAMGAAALLLVLFGVIAVGMVRGCFTVDPQEAARLEEERKEKEKKEQEEKREFDIAAPVVQPSEPKSPIQPVKPGHWAFTSQQMRANFRDFVGDSRLTIVNQDNRPYAVPYTPFVLRASRPVLLTKGRPKATEATIYIPQTNQAVRLATTLEERGLGFSNPQPPTTFTRMPAYQYHMAVLAREPTRYSLVKSLDSVRVPFDGESDADDTEDPVHYRVSLTDISQDIPLPDNPLTWTSIAYILWDEVDPQLFTPEQQRALVDWIHWGGQVIMSGPDSLDLLQGSFLEPYLPATNGGPRTIAADDTALAEFSDGWMISTRRTPGEPLRPTAPWSAITLKLHEEAKPLVSTGEGAGAPLFVERQIGRGRIVVSAVQLAERDLVNWRSGFESFFNACLLRRPPRVYTPGYFGDVTLLWADESLKDRRLDARLNSNLRYFARDLGVETAYRYREVRDGDMQFQFNQFGEAEFRREFVPPDQAGGLGAWNDSSATANAAREALREAAGVEVPNAGFVVLCLAAYLVTLVPINWLVFHTLGRVEWAWIAAPMIAIAGTFVVVHQAQLDIGFVRAQTEIAVLEQQPEHARAHLSRYTALYTSLSTTYDLDFNNMTTLAAPFPTKADYQLISGQSLSTVNFQRYDNVRLAGLLVSSNSTGMVHSEQMLTLDGPIQLGQSGATGGKQVENRTKFALASACVVRRPLPEERVPPGVALEGKWLGQILPGQSAAYSLQRLELETNEVPFRRERIDEEKIQGSARLNLEPMFRLALDPQHMEPGEVRFVARVDEVLPGETITPSASQVRGSTLIVAHLEYAPLPPPVKDRNTKRDIKPDDDRNDEEEDVFEF